MKKISTSRFYEVAAQTVARFPFTIGFTISLTFLSIHLSRNFLYSEHSVTLTKLNKCFYLGLLLTISVTLFSERNSLPAYCRNIILFICSLLCLSYFFVSEPSAIADYAKYYLICAALHLLVSFAAFTGTVPLKMMWAFNKSIFLRILLSFLYSGVLYAGLSLALIALNTLLSIDIASYVYLNLFYIITGIFNTWFFLAGVPKLDQTDDADPVYPRSLKIFTANILLPLVVIYMVILYAYCCKSFINGEWAESYVPAMVSVFAFFGILSLLLLNPLLQEKQNDWIHWFSKCFYFLLLPLVFAMLVVLNDAIQKNGVLLHTYLFVELALWLVFIGVYAIRQAQNALRMIPISLCIVCSCSTFGPWGMTATTNRSQTNIVIDILNQHKWFSADTLHITSASEQIPFREYIQVRTSLQKIENQSSIENLSAYFPQLMHRLDSAHETVQVENFILEYQRINGVLEQRDITNRTAPSSISAAKLQNEDEQTIPEEIYTSKTINLPANIMVSTKGYDFVVDFKILDAYQEVNILAHGKDTIQLEYKFSDNYFLISHSKLSPIKINMAAQLSKLFDLPNAIADPEQISLEYEGRQISAKITMTHLELNKVSDISVSRISGKLMIKLH